MIENCKYKGWGLGKSEHGMSSFPTSREAKKTKNGLGTNQNTKHIMGPIKFVKECNVI